jgi:hypothetical protein
MEILNMPSRKSVHEMQDFFSIIKIEDKSDNTKQKKSPECRSLSFVDIFSNS